LRHPASVGVRVAYRLRREISRKCSLQLASEPATPSHPRSSLEISMSTGRRANSPSGPGKPTAVETSIVKEEEGIVELTNEDDAPGGAEGVQPQQQDEQRRDDGSAAKP
jgi:hypothetical protein